MLSIIGPIGKSETGVDVDKTMRELRGELRMDYRFAEKVSPA